MISKPVDVDVREAASMITVTVRPTHVRELKLRFWLGLLLVRWGFRITGLGVKFEGIDK